MADKWYRKNPTYWGGKGKYQTLVPRLEKLSPSKGDSDVDHIQLFVAFSNGYHDYYNNGWCNQDNSRHREGREFLFDHDADLVATQEVSPDEVLELKRLWEQVAQNADEEDAAMFDGVDENRVQFLLERLGNAVILHANGMIELEGMET